MTDQPAHTHNLVILHTPNLQDVADFLIIRNMLLGQAPEIRTIIVSIDKPLTQDMVRAINERPTLLFSPTSVAVPAYLRGTRLLAHDHAKDEEMTLLAGAGIPVPPWILLRDGADAPTFDFGEVVVVKPNRGFQGKNVNLLRATDVPAYAAAATAAGTSGLIVQQWIDTGAYPCSYRVMTVLGEPVYCIISQSKVRLAVDAEAIPAHGMPASSNGQARTIACINDSEVIALAGQVHKALPQFPVLGIDIVRDDRTKKLHVLEINSGGFTWHLSSNYAKLQHRQYRLDVYNQFGALKIISRAMADATRRLAS